MKNLVKAIGVTVEERALNADVALGAGEDLELAQLLEGSP